MTAGELIFAGIFVCLLVPALLDGLFELVYWLVETRPARARAKRQEKAARRRRKSNS
jgi:hypothetical protein